MFVGNDWPDMSPNEERRLTLDFVNDIDPSVPEVISSATWSCEVPPELNVLTDAAPQAHLDGDPVVSGTFVTQKIRGLLPGVTYRMRCLAVTNAAQPELFAHVRCVGEV